MITGDPVSAHDRPTWYKQGCAITGPWYKAFLWNYLNVHVGIGKTNEVWKCLLWQDLRIFVI